MGVPTRVLLTIVALGGLAALSGCGTAGAAEWRGANGESGGKPAGAAITAPVDGAVDVPAATELTLTGLTPASTITLTDAAGTAVTGTLREDGSTWVPAAQLRYATAYTAIVTTPDTEPATSKVTFTTMAKPGKLINVSTPLQDGKVYGVALPIVARFGAEVAKDQRANVERRLFVTTEPAQVGSWHWFSGTEVHYRSKDYWQVGTKLAVRLATGGLFLGGKGYGAKDVTISATIGDKLVMVIDDATHMMTVTQNDQVLRTVPISLGKASTPTSSGAMVVMTKAQSELFVSTDPSDPYRETVYWTQRLTNGGEYLHAAPWSVGDQGKRNVSHGCTNMSTENAKWLFGISKIGDPVTVQGTPRKLQWGNGWTAWDRPWDEYVKGSALYTAAVEPGPSTSTGG